VNIGDTPASTARASLSVRAVVSPAAGGLCSLVVDVAPDVGRSPFGGKGENIAALVAHAA
jgi:hypothetical protein